MTRLKALNPETANGKTGELFIEIKKKLGMVPNMMRTMGQSPALLEGYLGLNSILGSGALGARLGEQIALAVAEENSCEYCASAHTLIAGKLMGVDNDTILASRKGDSADLKVKAALQFAQVLSRKRGLVNDADINGVRNAGYTDGEIGEIIGHVALNVLTNYFNNTAQTEIDFPKVPLLK